LRDSILVPESKKKVNASFCHYDEKGIYREMVATADRFVDIEERRSYYLWREMSPHVEMRL